MHISHSKTDVEIIDSILSGVKNDYEFLIRRYNERLYRVGISILKNKVETEDAMQETYIKAYQQLGKFRRESLFSTWLTRIMINESLSRVRARKKITEYSESETFSMSGGQPETPEHRTIQKEMGEILEGAINKLPEKYQVVFMMREIEEMNVTETAECLQITRENVKVRLHRAKELLKMHLRPSIQEVRLFEFHQSRCDAIVHTVFIRLQIS